RMRELVMKYKAEKVCHKEMVKIPLVDLKVLEDGSFRICMDYRKLSEIAIRNRCQQMRVHEEEIPKTNFRTRLHEVKGGARVAFKDEPGAAEEREASCEAQQGQSRVKRKIFGCFRNKMGNEPILALPKGSDNFVVMRKARVRMHAKTKREGDVKTLIMEEAHATKYSVCPGWKSSIKGLRVNCNDLRYVGGSEGKITMEFIPKLPRTSSRYDAAEIGEGKMIGLEMKQETTKLVVIKERLKEAKDRQERKGVVRFGKKGELAPRYIVPFEILKRIDPVAYRLRLPDELSIENYLSGVKISSKHEIALIL
nr:reverse transcriptase domain-containing protein [Tanacetum cinerariifolium]